MPIFWPIFKDVVHHCPFCHNVLAQHSRIRLPKVEKEIFTIQVGSCALVLSRKYAYLFFGVIASLICFLVFRSHREGRTSMQFSKPGVLLRADHVVTTAAEAKSMYGISLPSDASIENGQLPETPLGLWETFVEECGTRTSLGNALKAGKRCFFFVFSGIFSVISGL